MSRVCFLKRNVYVRAKKKFCKEEECGHSSHFSLHLASSAADFKAEYECHFPDRQIFEALIEICFGEFNLKL